LVTLGIFALLVALLYGTFAATFESARQTVAVAEEYRVVRWGMRHLLRDLSMFYPFSLPPATSPFEGTDRSQWRAEGPYPDDLLRFTSLAHHRVRADAPESDQGEVTYMLREERLVREVRLAGGGRRTDEIGDRVWGLNFRYLSEGEWREEWSGNGQRFPEAVEVGLILRDSEQSDGLPKQVTTVISLPPIKNP